MVNHIQDFIWTWGKGTLAPKNFSGNIVVKIPDITPGEVIISKYIVNNVITNVVSGGTYNQYPIIHTFTDNLDGSWTVEIYNYSNVRQRKGLGEKVYW